MNISNTLISLGWIPKEYKDRDSCAVKCFMHGEKNGNALYFNVVGNYYKCFGKCQTQGKITDLLLKYGLSVPLDQLIYQQKKVEKIETKGDQHKIDYQKNIKDIFYLNNRGISFDIYSKNYIHLNNWDKRIYIPFLYENNFFGYSTRTILSEDDFLKDYCDHLGLYYESLSDNQINNIKMKVELTTDFKKGDWLSDWVYRYKIFVRYKNDKDIPKKFLVYDPITNKEIDSEEIFIVESQLDALKINQFGYKAIAIMGGGLKELAQINVIKHKSKGLKLICAFDNDIAGQKYYQQYIKISFDIPQRLDWSIFPNKKDIGELNKEEFEILRNNLTVL